MANVVTERVEGDDVVLTGLSGRLPESNSIEEFAQQLFDGVDLVTADDRRWTPGIYGLPKRSGKLKDLAHFDAMFFGVHVKQVQVMDPQQRMLLEVTYEAIVDAGLNPAELRGSRTGVYVAVAGSESETLWSTDLDKINGYALTGCCRPMFPNRVSYTFDLKGPSYAIDTACSSSMSALAQAVEAIRAGNCDAAIVASTNLCLSPTAALNFHRMGLLSPEGRCATFDASGNGYARSEAVVAVLVQRRRDARRLYCTVRGARMNTDGHKPQGPTYPSGDMQRRLAQETFEEAGLRPQDVAWVEAHGTGTKVGDPEEVNAIAELFCKDRQTPLLLGAIKTNMGHAEIASGICSIVKILLAMERGVIPGNLHFKTPNPDIPALNDGRIKVVDKNTPWDGGLVAVNSFGFGGANAHAIFEGGRGSRPPPAAYPAPRLVLASGRTDGAVKRLLKLAAEHQRDAELHALLDAVHAKAIPGHPRRGYAVLDPARGAAPVTEVLESEGEPRPVWFVFSGMGSQWAGMARELLRLPTFAASIARSAEALKPYDVDLLHVIAEAPSDAFNNIINSFVSIAAVQVALVDVLREINVRPEGIIGHSLGEIGCAYADETLSAEQTVLCAYWRGRCTLDARPAPGAMAAIGLGWEEAARRCPADVQLACHNSRDNVTISGPAASVKKFVKQLSEERVFVKLVDTAGIAFHSKYIATAGPLLRAKLQEVIPEPKTRSARWLSSSVPQDLWDSDLARLSDAEYHVNNFLSPVRFAGVLASVPENAMVVEVAPHALLQAVLKRTLPSAAHVPLVHRAAPNALVHLLAAVGKAYAAGAQPQVSRLYPAVSWPVSRGTPSLASHIQWDHSTEWNVADYKTASRYTQYIIEYDVCNPDDAFLAEHGIDGRIVYPATGYLMMVWRAIANMNRLDLEQAAVVFEDVQFRRATILPSDAPVRFLVSLLGGTGEFEVCEGGEVVVTGTARLTDDPVAECLPTNTILETEEIQDDLPALDSEDIYKKLRLCGYRHTGVFRGIISSDACGTRGLLKWQGNWIAFMDAVLQFSLISSDSRALYLPMRLQQAVFNPAAQREAIKAASDGILAVTRNSDIDVTVSGGIEFRGLTVSTVSRRINQQVSPKLEKYVFLPFETSHCNHEDVGRCKREALTAALQLVVENCGVPQLKLMEPGLQRPVEALLLPHVMHVLEAEPQVRVDATLAAGTDKALYAASMDPLGVKVSDKDLTCLESDFHLVVCGDVLARRGGELGALCAASGAGFVLLEEPARALDDPAAQAQLSAASLALIARARAGAREYVLLRRAAAVPAARVVLEARDDDYGWVERLKDAMKRAESEDMRVYVWSRAPGSGVQGLATCLRREPGGDRLRLYYLPGARDAFDPDAPAYRAQVQRDLAFSVLRDGVWGTYRHLPLEDTAGEVMVEEAYADMLMYGDLSSLRWIERNIQRSATTQGREHTLCRVSYASLNFRDVMVATGMLSLDVGRPGLLTDMECFLGFEFSGHSSTGKRVMGIVKSAAIATTTQPDETLMWDVPKQWSLKEAATVPIAYATVYYGLVVRGRMRRGEAVLVHAGAGGVGQAAIAVALHAGCTVFTTVGTPDKRAFLRERFPQLPDANIGNSRDCSFEQLVLRRTRGRGVDLVLNSLAGDKLRASLRCLGKGGRFIEIGKVDLAANTSLGMSLLLNNSAVHGVSLDDLFIKNSNIHEKKEVARCMAEGIAAGVVRPLPTLVYDYNQLEQAFRYTATGKHIGKVLIRVREEEAGGKPAPARLLSAMPRTYMHPAKSYVLVGGLGGFGLELGEWLVSRGARILVINSRSGVRTGYQARCIRKWRALGVRVLVSTADATTAAGARALLQEAAAAAPVGGIFHLAAVLRDAFLENQTPDAFRAVAKPKIDALSALDITSRELAPELEYFVAFSSMACGRGNAGQSNYGLANSGMERLCEQRRADGLPALAVQWGAVGDVGLVAAMHGGEDKEVGGTVPQRIASCLQTLETLLRAPHAVVSSFVLAAKKRAHEKPTQDHVQAVANILGVRDLSKVLDSSTLGDMGVDSLMIAEIRQTLERGYDMLLGVQEIRALTFRKLRSMAPSPAGPMDKNLQFVSPGDLMPDEVLVKMPSQPYSSEEAVFMVHPIEGVVDMLRGVAALVRGAVYGLQCARAAPLGDMAALARFYVQHVRAAQPQPPYTLLGYSFGAGIAFEMALQLENQGCSVRLVLVDGSPAYTISKTKRAKQGKFKLLSDEADLLAYLGMLFYNLNMTKVSSELKQLPDREARVDRMTELIGATGARVNKKTVHDAAKSLLGKITIGENHKLEARLRAPVTLFTARDSSAAAALGADYGLKSVCEGELSTRQLAGTHRTILAGDAARAIADHVSELLAQR